MTTKYLNLYFITPNIVQITVCMNWKWQGVESRALSITAEAGCSVDALLHRKGSHVGALVGTWTHLLRQDLSERTTASYSKEIAGVCRTGRAKANRKPPSGRQGSADALSWELVCSFTKDNNIHYLGALAITHMKKGRRICVHACVHMCPSTENSIFLPPSFPWYPVLWFHPKSSSVPWCLFSTFSGLSNPTWVAIG